MRSRRSSLQALSSPRGRGRALARAQSLPTSRQGPRLTFGCIRTRDGEIVPGSPPHGIAAAEFVDLVRRRRERPENSVGNFAAGERQKQQRQQRIESSIGHSSPGVDMLGRWASAPKSYLPRRPPMRGLRSLGGRAPETTPRRFNLGLRGTVASCPHLGGGRRIFGNIKPNDGTRCALHEAGAFGGLRRQNQTKPNGSNAPPA